ncbi:MAG: 3-hydroxyacyl-CoA dehydrogenase NAD-binding domain-containing protein [Planctomycetota bacterium]|jgi:3-hydroxyacyl-CoA dehydrogenase/enoyl-CoA hydratase/3-hydroxybutyryl-CoA epimerase
MSISTADLDLDNLPVPDDAPPLGSCVALEREHEGRLLRLRILSPHRESGPVFDAALLRDFWNALREIEADTTAVGLVLCGRDPLTFCFGADVDGIADLTDASQAERIGRVGQEIFQKLHKLGKRGNGRLTTVAAVGGPVPGGAFEVSLACDHIVLADDPKSRIGLPEVMLGILPGWGGSQRLPRRIGVPAALGAILTGKLYPAKPAKKLGLVDRLTHPDFLMRVADGIALGKERLRPRDRGWKLWIVDRNPLALAVIKSQARKGVTKQTRGFYPAPYEALELTAGALQTDLKQGLHEEARALGELAVSPVCKAIVSIYQSGEAAKRKAKGSDGKRPERFERAAVVGAGIMGAGIASLLATKRISTRLADLSQAQLDEAQVTHERAVAKLKKRRRLQAFEADGALDRLELTRTELGFGRCDFVIEAIAEVLEVKRKVLGAYAERVRDDAVICTNTSSLSVDAIAEGLPSPERVLGMHFFNPVPKMPLVEIIRGARTDDAVLRRVVQLAVDLGKTPVVCNDAPGFIVNRLLAPYLDEAMRLYETGSAPAELDRMALDFGLPMGPFTLIDEVGIDIAAHTANSLEQAFGGRMAPSGVLRPLFEAGELGKKSGKGIFLHSKSTSKTDDSLPENPRLRRPKGAPIVSTLTKEDRLDRMVLPMVNEAARILAEGVVDNPAQLDLATVYGMGFAPFRGGVLSYADSRGLRAIVDRLHELSESNEVAHRPGGPDRFRPCEHLIELAESGRGFRDR